VKQSGGGTDESENSRGTGHHRSITITMRISKVAIYTIAAIVLIAAIAD
jgi:hypothetical protein